MYNFRSLVIYMIQITFSNFLYFSVKSIFPLPLCEIFKFKIVILLSIFSPAHWRISGEIQSLCDIQNELAYFRGSSWDPSELSRCSLQCSNLEGWKLLYNKD